MGRVSVLLLAAMALCSDLDRCLSITCNCIAYSIINYAGNIPRHHGDTFVALYRQLLRYFPRYQLFPSWLVVASPGTVECIYSTSQYSYRMHQLKGILSDSSPDYGFNKILFSHFVISGIIGFDQVYFYQQKCLSADKLLLLSRRAANR